MRQKDTQQLKFEVMCLLFSVIASWTNLLEGIPRPTYVPTSYDTVPGSSLHAVILRYDTYECICTIVVYMLDSTGIASRAFSCKFYVTLQFAYCYDV